MHRHASGGFLSFSNGSSAGKKDYPRHRLTGFEQRLKAAADGIFGRPGTGV
jgi:hypothetical protein